jgi:NifB/MoaA-like Fe-S oxidoreductase
MESSKNVINQVHKWQNKLLTEKGSRVVYLSDEFYINADEDMPKYKDYEGFPQIENGVGMVALFKKEIGDTLKHKKKDINLANRKISIVTGRLVYRNILQLVDKVKDAYNGLEVNVYDIENEFFGPNATVTGLLTGVDIVKQLKGRDLGQELLMSRSMLRAGEHVLLDDYTVERIEAELGVPIRIVDSSGKDFVNALIGK